ncbi:hypothetical protein CCR75_001707 [Bremia lactucae]|uniref:Uncharacterized protein n=1 Tax=Bremia lactucae TaxID=4779 RepID=A0A976IC33_BRELC|nr:hypothetical protein CCR75_001707 [Bremia lactucae]
MFSSPRHRTLAVSHFVTKIAQSTDLSAPVIFALHGWRFRGLPVTAMQNSDFHRSLYTPPPIPIMPHTALKVPSEPNLAGIWRREQALDRDVLPILGDLKFRLQYNALNTRASMVGAPFMFFVSVVVQSAKRHTIYFGTARISANSGQNFCPSSNHPWSDP